MTPTPYSREQIERAARLYHTTRDAGKALGMAPGSFSRICRRYGIETPNERRRLLSPPKETP